MDKKSRFTLMFIAGATGVAIIASAATALVMVRLIRWNLANCGQSPSCSASDWIISYWWALFVPSCLAAAVFFRRVHDRRLATFHSKN